MSQPSTTSPFQVSAGAGGAKHTPPNELNEAMQFGALFLPESISKAEEGSELLPHLEEGSKNFRIEKLLVTTRGKKNLTGWAQ